jgi:hypothetical protein
VAVHIYPQTIHRTTQVTTEQHKYKLMWKVKQIDISVKKNKRGSLEFILITLETNNENRNVRNLYRGVKISEMLSA